MYITATYLMHPVDPKHTSAPNYSKNKANFIADEVVSLTKKLRNSDLIRCNVIIDIKNETVIKCRDFQLNGEVVQNPEYKPLFDHFREMYPQQIVMLVDMIKNPEKGFVNTSEAIDIESDPVEV